MSRYFAIFVLRMRSLFRKAKLEQELEKELQLHLDELTSEFRAQGMSAEDASFATRRAMGGTSQLAEECRDQRRTAFWDRAVQDLNYSIRALRGNPMFTAIGISSLALGIGANTLIFSVVHSILLRPLPYLDPAQLLSINQISARMPKGVVLPPELRTGSKTVTHSCNLALSTMSKSRLPALANHHIWRPRRSTPNSFERSG